MGSITDSEWQPEVQPDELEPVFEEVDPQPIVTTDLGYQTPQNGMGRPIDGGNNGGGLRVNTPEGDESSQDLINTKAIGRWGEKYVFSHLKKDIFGTCDYQSTDGSAKIIRDGMEIEIRWLNSISEKGKGYDFVILKDHEEIEYIEVKSKTGTDKEFFLISGVQWEFARKLFNDGDGEKYKIYTVINAGTNKACIKIIKNPAKLWKEGKLYADPVRFRL